jgi:hypothetical protein
MNRIEATPCKEGVWLAFQFADHDIVWMATLDLDEATFLRDRLVAAIEVRQGKVACES